MNTITNSYIESLHKKSVSSIISSNLDILEYLLENRYIKIDCNYVINTNANTIDELIDELDNNITKPKIKLTLYNNVNLKNENDKYDDCIKIKDKRAKRRKINHPTDENIIHQKYLNKIYQCNFITHYLMQDRYKKIILLNKIKLSINDDDIFKIILSYLQ